MLTPEQKAEVAAWIAAGDNLSAVQHKLTEQFKLSLTYRDVRFLVDDLNLALKDPAPKVDTTDVSKGATPASPGPDEPLGSDEDDVPAGGNVSVSMDKVTLIPGALASGSVTFSDGVSAKWVVDQYGRPGFTNVSQPGYRPSPTDGQAFMQELTKQLQQRGF